MSLLDHLLPPSTRTPPLHSSLTLKEKGFLSFSLGGVRDQVCGAERWAGVKSSFQSFHHFFHLREGNPKTSSPVPGGYNPGPQGKEAVRNTGFSYPPSCLGPGWVWKKYNRDSSSGESGHRAGFIALQQSLNKSRVSRAEGRGGEGWAKRGRAASVQLAGRTQILQARESGPPFSGGLGGPALARLRFQICCHHGPFRVLGNS